MPTDPFSTYSHAFGALAALVWGVFLVRRALNRESGRAGAVVSVVVFVLSAALLLSMSATYHALPRLVAARATFLRLDHAAIFVLIAGTFTPIHTIAFRGWMRWGVLGFIWSCAIAGVAIKTVFFHHIPYWVGIVAYLGMGWCAALAMVSLWRWRSLRYASPLILGGVAYSAGALCEVFNEPNPWPGVINSHEVFHVAVLVGLGCHWGLIDRLVRREGTAAFPVGERTRRADETGWRGADGMGDASRANTGSSEVGVAAAVGPE